MPRIYCSLLLLASSACPAAPRPPPIIIASVGHSGHENDDVRHSGLSSLLIDPPRSLRLLLAPPAAGPSEFIARIACLAGQSEVTAEPATAAAGATPNAPRPALPRPEWHSCPLYWHVVLNAVATPRRGPWPPFFLIINHFLNPLLCRNNAPASQNGTATRAVVRTGRGCHLNGVGCGVSTL